jgi:hypothetical protein
MQNEGLTSKNTHTKNTTDNAVNGSSGGGLHSVESMLLNKH